MWLNVDAGKRWDNFYIHTSTISKFLRETTEEYKCSKAAFTIFFTLAPYFAPVSAQCVFTPKTKHFNSIPFYIEGTKTNRKLNVDAGDMYNEIFWMYFYLAHTLDQCVNTSVIFSQQLSLFFVVCLIKFPVMLWAHAKQMICCINPNQTLCSKLYQVVKTWMAFWSTAKSNWAALQYSLIWRKAICNATHKKSKVNIHSAIRGTQRHICCLQC